VKTGTRVLLLGRSHRRGSRTSRATGTSGTNHAIVRGAAETSGRNHAIEGGAAEKTSGTSHAIARAAIGTSRVIVRLLLCQLTSLRRHLRPLHRRAHHRHPGGRAVHHSQRHSHSSGKPYDHGSPHHHHGNDHHHQSQRHHGRQGLLEIPAMSARIPARSAPAAVVATKWRRTRSFAAGAVPSGKSRRRRRSRKEPRDRTIPGGGQSRRIGHLCQTP